MSPGAASPRSAPLIARGGGAQEVVAAALSSCCRELWGQSPWPSPRAPVGLPVEGRFLSVQENQLGDAVLGPVGRAAAGTPGSILRGLSRQMHTTGLSKMGS